MSDFTHLDETGRARMVDVSSKNSTPRSAVATGAIRMSGTTLDAIKSSSLKKGDVLSVARIAGIMGAKKTAELIPLCHPIALTEITVDFSFDDNLPGVRVEAQAKTLDRTGVEMEALTAVSAALLTIYDMAKALDRGMTITSVALVEKSGGRSGDWKRDDSPR
jgi:cyclic pyranopterin phosphate synthase